MAEIEVADGSVEVKLTLGEKTGGVHGNFSFPITSITRVSLNADPITEVHGFKASGAGFPNRKIGTWRSDGAKTYFSVVRGEPGLVFVLTGEDFDRVILSLSNPENLLASVIAAGAPQAQ